MADKAFSLGISDFSSYAPLEKLIGRFDIRARTVAGQLFSTRAEAEDQRRLHRAYIESDFLKSEEAALSSLSRLMEMAAGLQRDATWLLEDVKSAIRCFSERAKIEFDYRYGSREEARCARSNLELFFKAIWNRIYVLAEAQMWIKWRSGLSDELLAEIGARYGVSPDHVVAFVDTAFVAVRGQTGMVLSQDGISAISGSAIAGKIADNKLVKRFLFGRAKDYLEKNRPQSWSISWQKFFERDFVVSRTEGGKLLLGGTYEFSASEGPRKGLEEFFALIKSWASRFEGPIACEKGVPGPDAEMQGQVRLEEFPKMKTDSRVQVNNEEGDFPSAVPIPELKATCLYNTMVRSAAKAALERQPDCDVMVVPDVDQNKFAKFIGLFPEQERISGDECVCFQDCSFWRTEGIAVSEQNLYVRKGNDCTVIPLSHIISVRKEKDDDEGMVVVVSDVEVQEYGDYGETMFVNREYGISLSVAEYFVPMLQDALCLGDSSGQANL